MDCVRRRRQLGEVDRATRIALEHVAGSGNPNAKATMRRILAIAVLVSLIPILIVMGQARASRARSSNSADVEREVRRASAEEVTALVARDTTALERIWSDDFVVTNPLNQLVDKRQVLALIETDTLAFRSYDRRIEYFHRFGDVAVVAGSEVVIWAGRMPLAGTPSSLRFTAVWREHDGRWEEVARHANVLPQPR